MKEAQIPVSEGQEPLSIEDAKGQEHIRVPEDAKRPEGLVTSGGQSSQCGSGRSCGEGVNSSSIFRSPRSGRGMVFEQVMEVKKQRRELEQQRMQVDQI